MISQTDVTFFTSAQPQPVIRSAKSVKPPAPQLPAPVTEPTGPTLHSIAASSSIPMVASSSIPDGEDMDISLDDPTVIPVKSDPDPLHQPTRPQKRHIADESVPAGPSEVERKRPKVMPPKKRKKRADEDILFIKKVCGCSLIPSYRVSNSWLQK